MTYGIGTYQEAYRRFCDGEAMGVEFSFSDWGEGAMWIRVFSYSVVYPLFFFPFFSVLPGNGMGYSHGYVGRHSVNVSEG